jgi:zinc D-Ala-D-Ala carboxypeptidase
MVDIMQWVAKKHLPLFLIAATILVGVLTSLSTGSISLEPQPVTPLVCFENSTSTLRVTTENSCPSPLISLGNAALNESATAEGVVINAHPLLIARFESAKSAAQLEGVHLYITSSFRSFDRQGELFAAAIKKYGSESEAAKWVLPPQYSHHPKGLALDVNYPGDPIGAKWLEQNGARFGLCRVYANEWWHFEGVIAPGGICPKMAENALVDKPDTGSIS